MLSHANLQIYQGDDYAAVVTVAAADGTPADLSGFMAASQIRRNVADKEPEVVATVATEIQSSQVYIAVRHEDTGGLSGNYVWDLRLINTATGLITTILAGQVVVTSEVTRAQSGGAR